MTAKVKEKPEKKKAGRPSDYSVEYHDPHALKLTMLGLTLEELAEFFEVQPSTIYEWKNKFPTFAEAIKNGKEHADAEVAMSLYKRATGYTAPDVHVGFHNGKAVITPITKHYAPDVLAQIYWLKNRMPKKWRDQIQVEGNKINVTIGGKKVTVTQE